MSGVEPELYDWDIIFVGNRKRRRCLWCPNKPRFATLEDLREHWLRFGRLKFDHLNFYKRIQARIHFAKGKFSKPKQKKEKETKIQLKMPLFKDKPAGL